MSTPLRGRRRGVLLGRDRVANRTSAYVYGNVMALSALTASASPGEIINGHTLLVLVATGVMTLLAHALSHHMATVVRYPDPQERQGLSHELREEARDSLPIATSVGLPAVFLVMGMLGWLSEVWAMNLAIGTTMVRFLLMGSAVSWCGGTRKAPLAALWSGIGLAVLALVIAVGKTVLTH